MATPYTSSPDAIAAEAAIIRVAWTTAEHEARLERALNRQIELVALTLKLMAMESGMIPVEEGSGDD